MAKNNRNKNDSQRTGSAPAGPGNNNQQGATRSAAEEQELADLVELARHRLASVHASLRAQDALYMELHQAGLQGATPEELKRSEEDLRSHQATTQRLFKQMDRAYELSGLAAFDRWTSTAATDAHASTSSHQAPPQQRSANGSEGASRLRPPVDPAPLANYTGEMMSVD